MLKGLAPFLGILMEKENIMGTMKVSKLVWKIGFPMIISMVLQALYNVVDTMFVVNMGEEGTLGNVALSATFPVQILMIAIGVGTGVGINAILSRSLGMKDKEMANKVAGNGLFLGIIFSIAFMLFGFFGAEAYMRLMSTNSRVIEMGASYLKICCCLSFGSIGYAVVERFLMSTGKTNLSMICQITGAVLNIILDWVFIYPCNLGIEGAAWATIIGQIVSLVMALIFHYAINKEIDGNPKYIKPNVKVIGMVYKIGGPAFLMQAMLSFMMFGVLLIIGTIPNQETVDLLTGSFGIYYKMMQIALFAAFGLSNALISIVSFNYGMGEKKRVYDAAKWGIIATIIVTLLITVLYQILAKTICNLFALANGESDGTSKAALIDNCVLSLRIATIGYVFMGVSVAIQGVLQGLRKVFSPLIISALRLLVLVIPLTYLFTLTNNPESNIWWAFPISEIITCIVSILFLVFGVKKSFSESESTKR